MADLDIWIIIALLAISTLLTRCGIVMIGHRVSIPKRVQEMLRFAPACALTSIVVPDLLLGADGDVALTLSNPRLVAGVLALGFYLLRRNLLQAIIFGMLAFTLLRVFHIFGAGA